ncbi:MAG: helix-turn-helix domain-containing protein [Sphingosinicella sp.]|nr:helix-turn-helix domain-containing protein [Sphingosinicella sp.]
MPAAWIRGLRLEHARRCLEQVASNLKEVARRCGFGDEQALRRAFERRLGILPSDYAARFTGPATGYELADRAAMNS